MVRKLIHWIQYIFIRIVFLFLRLFPYNQRIQFVERMIFFLSKIISSVSKRIYGGIHQAFPNLTNDKIEELYNENLRVLARMVVDFEEGPRMNEEFMKQKFIYEPSEEEYKKVVLGGGILVLGHLGNWETHGVAITRLLKGSGKELYVFSKRQSNLFTNDWIERTRGKQNIRLLYTDESPRKALSLLKQGHLVAFIADQDAGKDGLFVPFLGKLASTFLGPAVFARNTNCPIYFMWSRYTQEGKLVFGYQVLQKPNIDPKKDPEYWEKAFTFQWVKILESKVLEHPASYFWLHRRWKRQPENPEEILEFWKHFTVP